MTLGKSHEHSMPQLPHREDEDNAVNSSLSGRGVAMSNIRGGKRRNYVNIKRNEVVSMTTFFSGAKLRDS